MTVTARIFVDYGFFTVSIGENTSPIPYEFSVIPDPKAHDQLVAWRPGELTVSTAMRFGELPVDVTASEAEPPPVELGDNDELDEITIRPRGNEVIVAGFAWDTSQVCDPLPESPSGFYRARMIATDRVMDVDEPTERFHLYLWPCQPGHSRVTRQVKHLE